MSKTITRKYIQRITKREGNTNIRQSSGGGGGGGGGASQYWVEENYISKLFFNQLFTVYDEDGNIVEPNDTESVIASIKSMFGFWTDAYLSALGNGEGGGAELTLASLADVDVHGVANGQALVYDAYTQKWVPGQAGLDPTSLWQELGSLGTEQISSTHLTTALSTYNPTNNFKTINGNSIIGTGDINVGGGGGAYLPLSGGRLSLTSISGLIIDRSGSGNPMIRYDNDVIYGYLGFDAVNNPVFRNTSGTYYSLIHDGNISSYNAGSATKLQTTRTIWGQNFNGTANVSGDLTDVGSIYATAAIGIHSNGNISLRYNSSNATTVIHSGTAFRPHSSAAENISLGTSSYRWATIYGTGLNVTGNATVGGSITGDTFVVSNTNSTGHLTFSRGSYNYISCSAAGGSIGFITNGASISSNNISLFISSGGDIGIGTKYPSYKLHVDGVAYASTGVYSGGYVTALSDIRHKDVKSNVRLTVSEVANAPAVKFLWKDRRQEGMQVGSIAQYWQKVMPEAIVKNADGELTMSYGVIALLASIATARKVEDHERRIRELERENEKLKKQLNAA